jgi:hypothetical protein
MALRLQLCYFLLKSRNLTLKATDLRITLCDNLYSFRVSLLERRVLLLMHEQLYLAGTIASANPLGGSGTCGMVAASLFPPLVGAWNKSPSSNREDVTQATKSSSRALAAL